MPKARTHSPAPMRRVLGPFTLTAGALAETAITGAFENATGYLMRVEAFSADFTDSSADIELVTLVSTGVYGADLLDGNGVGVDLTTFTQAINISPNNPKLLAQDAVYVRAANGNLTESFYLLVIVDPYVE